MSARDQSGDEIIDIKTLLKMLVDSQAKQAETQAKQAEIVQAKQEEFQQQILEILRSTNSTSNNHQHQGTSNTWPSTTTTSHHNDFSSREHYDSVAAKDHQVAIYVHGKNDQLYEAISDNKLETVKEILQNNPEVVKEGITYDSSTALHMAIFWRRDIMIVGEIVKLMQPEILEYKTSENGYTACHLAAMYGYAEAAKMMVHKNSKLTQIRDTRGRTPLEVALLYVTIGQKETVEYLYSVTREADLGQDGVTLLRRAINANFYDMALCLVKRFPQLVTEKSLEDNMCGLELLVRRPFAFRSGTKLTWLQDRIYSLMEVDVQSTYVRLVHTINTSKSPECTERDDKSEPPDVDVTEIGEKNPSGCTKRDKENPPEKSEASRDANAGVLRPYITRVPSLKKLYNLKVMHEQAIALLKQMLAEVSNAKNDSEVVTFFQNNPGIMKVAIKHGIIEVVLECLRKFTYLIWFQLPDQRMIEMAIAERNETMVSLICDCSDIYGDKIDLVSTTDDEENTILHYAAKLAPSSQLNLVAGVALQMQREVQWFKGVESIMLENDRSRRNKKGDTAHDIFAVEHQDLLKKGEDWMKDTSGSCMIVAALIATVAFAVAFTVPGGNISDSNNTMKSTPVFLRENSFTLFVVADSFALFASITSVLMFLAIYTSRYAEMDFLKSLPQKLIVGFATLFISMAAILIAFGASLFIVVGTLFTSCPIVFFAWLQLPLFCQMVHSTYWGSVLWKHRYILPTVEKNIKKKKV
ncbi:hypothetical protein MKW92_014392 [Papaver armeniacum]|nr:hypothetical protein MKW92_014392 [Papaver armeniacum]